MKHLLNEITLNVYECTKEVESGWSKAGLKIFILSNYK